MQGERVFPQSVLANPRLPRARSSSPQKPPRKSEKLKQSRSLQNMNPTRGEYNRIIGHLLEEEKAKQSLERDKNRDLTRNSLDLIDALLVVVKA